MSRSGFEKWTSARRQTRHRFLSLFQTRLTGASEGKKVKEKKCKCKSVEIYTKVTAGIHLTPTRAVVMCNKACRWGITVRIWARTFLLSSIWKLLLMFPFMAGAGNDKKSVRLYWACGQRKWEIEHKQLGGWGEGLCKKKKKRWALRKDVRAKLTSHLPHQAFTHELKNVASSQDGQPRKAEKEVDVRNVFFFYGKVFVVILLLSTSDTVNKLSCGDMTNHT